ncbi:hypothetical protein C8C76_15510 [Halanaerobium saccharolyticum]|uniref:Uncharacterized protein n=1 Tax=Halanaerobium saccharolyticum TaxID=43595 RepID=A0A2T5RFC5_9FIRM|nr:hypothetical protein [Halanaerobium saccharolyticum]PTV93044.1 hypothetical protein C8C76_15510 [Halanaerobium saccharolyticum]
MKNLMQLKDLVKNLAKEKNINSQVILRNYMMQRLLLKIVNSDYRNNFILKGGMLVADIFNSGIILSHWNRYRNKFKYAKEIEFSSLEEQIINELFIK